MARYAKAFCKETGIEVGGFKNQQKKRPNKNTAQQNTTNHKQKHKQKQSIQDIQLNNHNTQKTTRQTSNRPSLEREEERKVASLRMPPLTAVNRSRRAGVAYRETPAGLVS